MFTIRKLKNSRDIDKQVVDSIHNMLSVYEMTQDGKWLMQLDWRTMKFKWCDAMADSDVLGAYSMFNKDTLYLQPPRIYDCAKCTESFKTAVELAWVASIMSLVVHELRHAYQHKKLGWAYCLLQTVGIRELTLERDADKAEKSADTFMNRYQELHSTN